MLAFNWTKAARRVLIAGCAVLLGTAGLVPGPATADISRSCNATLTISTDGGTRVSRAFTIPVTVSSRVYANRARERSRDAIISCVREHWQMRMSDGRPHWCNNGGNYPFQGFNEDMTDAICRVNPGRQSFLVDVSVTITGNTGCVPNNQWAPIPIADDYRVYCWIAPQPEVRSGWNLPGRDYRWFYMDASDRARDCDKTCADESRCEAWTYKHAMGGDPPMCFLKESVPAWRRDERFVSGIKGEVLH